MLGGRRRVASLFRCAEVGARDRIAQTAGPRSSRKGGVPMRRFVTALVLALACSVSLTARVEAQDYPNRPITMTVPFPAGGPTDGVGRVMADALSRALGERVIVENVAG